MFSGRMPKKKRKPVDYSEDQLPGKKWRNLAPCIESSNSPAEPTPGCSTDSTWSVVDHEANTKHETWKVACTAVTDSPTNLPGSSSNEQSSIHSVNDLSQDKQITEGMSNWKRVEAHDLISEDSSHKCCAQSKDSATHQGIPNKLKNNIAIEIYSVFSKSDVPGCTTYM